MMHDCLQQTCLFSDCFFFRHSTTQKFIAFCCEFAVISNQTTGFIQFICVCECILFLQQVQIKIHLCKALLQEMHLCFFHFILAQFCFNFCSHIADFCFMLISHELPKMFSTKILFFLSFLSAARCVVNNSICNVMLCKPIRFQHFYVSKKKAVYI